MLKTILSAKVCADCKYCCWFNAYDAKVFADLPLQKSTVREGWYQCAHLKIAEGCTCTEDEKPFSCSLWPLFVTQRNGKFLLMLATDCPACTDAFRVKLKKLLDDGLAARIRRELDRRCDFVLPMYDNAEFLREL